VCPFIDTADARCADHLTLRNVSSAFAHCADRYKTCPVYQMLAGESNTDEQAQRASRLLAAG